VQAYPGGRPQRLLPQWQGACRSPQWGLGDRALAFAGHDVPPPTNRRLFPHVWIVDLATGQARDVTRHLDQMVGNYAAAQDQRLAYRPATVRWPPGSPFLYFQITEQGAVHLYRAAAADGRLERLIDGPCVVAAFSPATVGCVAFVRADPENPGDVYVWEGGRARRLTDANPWLRWRRLATPQEYWYAGVDGARVHAWMLPPLDLREGERYPTIVYVHCSMFNWDFNHEFQCYAAAGFAVAYFNQWGTTAGYGQAWTLGTQGDQGGRDYEEIMLGVDDLLTRFPFVDGDRLGVTGWSCGGFLTTWIVGHTQRFRAAAAQVAISNYVNFWGTSDGGPEGTFRETGALPWQDLQTVWRQSPLAYVERIHTPLLILHGDEDDRVGIDQAEQLFAALRWLGREVEFVWFCGESHLFHQGGTPVNRIERLRRLVRWFERHLRAVPAPGPRHRGEPANGG
jgi:dipeptidyl aminopeptidase/acylaminoacyl peptidase